MLQKRSLCHNKLAHYLCYNRQHTCTNRHTHVTTGTHLLHQAHTSYNRHAHNCYKERTPVTTDTHLLQRAHTCYRHTSRLLSLIMTYEIFSVILLLIFMAMATRDATSMTITKVTPMATPTDRATLLGAWLLPLPVSIGELVMAIGTWGTCKGHILCVKIHIGLC